jgi:hypothetical protein
MALLFLCLLVENLRNAGIEIGQQLIDEIKKVKLAMIKMLKSTKIHSKVTLLNNQQRQLSGILQLKT